MLSVLLRRGRSDYLHFSPAQGRLQNICRVYGPLGTAGADDRMQLVNEQYHVPGPLHVLQHGFHPFLEIAAVFCTCKQRRHVQRHYAFFPQAVWRAAGSHTHCQALGHRGFAHARLPYEHWVVFCAAGEYLDGPIYFLSPAYYRVYFPRRRKLCEIPAVLVQYSGISPTGWRSRLCLRFWAARGSAEGQHYVCIQLVQVSSRLYYRSGAGALILPQYSQ